MSNRYPHTYENDAVKHPHVPVKDISLSSRVEYLERTVRQLLGETPPPAMTEGMIYGLQCQHAAMLLNMQQAEKNVCAYTAELAEIAAKLRAVGVEPLDGAGIRQKYFPGLH